MTTGLYPTDTPKLDTLLVRLVAWPASPVCWIETDADHYPYGYPQTYLLPTVVTNEIAWRSQNMMVYTPIAQGITTDDSEFSFYRSADHRRRSLRDGKPCHRRDRSRKPTPTLEALLPWVGAENVTTRRTGSSGSTVRTC